jgi:hypothetical protein
MLQPIERARPHLVTTAPGRFEMRLMAPTLLDFCYLNVASILASAPLAVCSECGRVFVVGDKRQKFCEPKCAGRSRFRNCLARVGQRRAGGVDLCSRVLIEGGNPTTSYAPNDVVEHRRQSRRTASPLLALTSPRCSTPFTPRRAPAWESACLSAGRSWRVMAAVSGRSRTTATRAPRLRCLFRAVQRTSAIRHQ